jgi:hypothetical protein
MRKTYRSNGGFVMGSHWELGRKGILHVKQAAPFVASGVLTEVDADGKAVVEKKDVKKAKPKRDTAPTAKPHAVAPPAPRRRRVTDSASMRVPANLSTAVKSE